MLAARGNDPRTERWILTSTILAASLVFIDGTALNVALPRIQSGLGATAADLLWIVNGYLLVLAALIPLGGALGDRWGKRRVYMTGIAAFTAGSLLCGLAPDTGLLIAARVFQGLGGALLVPGSLALLNARTEPSRRGRAIGVWSAATTLVTVAGPLLGGLLCDLGLWRWVFFINVPLGAAALAVLGTRVAEDEPQARKAMDAAGSALLSLGLAALTWGAQTVPENAGDPLAWAAVAAGIVLLAAFGFVETRHPNPVIPFRLFRFPGFAAANGLTFFLYGALSVMGVFLTLNLVQVQGYPVALAGMALLPFAACMTLLSRPMGGWADRLGPRPFLAAGPFLVALGFAALGAVGKTEGWTSYAWTFLPGVALFGLGMSVTVAPLSAAVMASAGDRHAGVASGINNAVSRVAGVLCLAVLGALAVALFPGFWRVETQGLPLTDVQRTALDVEAARMAGAAVPQGWDQELVRAVTDARDRAFLMTWRLVMAGCSALALLASICGWWGTPRTKRPEPAPEAPR